jgi:hypothetical protein
MCERLTIDGWRVGVIPAGFELARVKRPIGKVLHMIGGGLFRLSKIALGHCHGCKSIHGSTATSAARSSCLGTRWSRATCALAHAIRVVVCRTFVEPGARIELATS